VTQTLLYLSVWCNTDTTVPVSMMWHRHSLRMFTGSPSVTSRIACGSSRLVYIISGARYSSGPRDTLCNMLYVVDCSHFICMTACNQSPFDMWNLRFPQQCCWGFRSSGIWHSVAGLGFPKVFKEYSSLTFNGSEQQDTSHPQRPKFLLFKSGSSSI
jgi:hypothetical protein